VGGGGPQRRVVLDEVVCVALVEVPVGRGRRVASAVCVAVQVVVGEEGPLPKVVLDEVVCVVLVEVAVGRGCKVASVVCVAVLAVGVVVEVAAPKVAAEVEVRAVESACPSLVSWQPRC
jgi:hypothetical protein